MSRWFIYFMALTLILDCAWSQDTLRLQKAVPIADYGRCIPIIPNTRAYTLTRDLISVDGLDAMLPPFHEVQLFQVDSATFTLKLSRLAKTGLIVDEFYQMDNQQRTLFYQQTEAGLQTVRSDVDDIFKSFGFGLGIGSELYLNLSHPAGRVATSALAAGCYYGATIAVALAKANPTPKPTDFWAALGDFFAQAFTGVLITGAVATVTGAGTYLLLADKPIPTGAAALAAGGLTNGLVLGTALYESLYGNTVNSDGQMIAASVGSIAAGVGGYMFAKDNQISESQANMMNIFGLIGSGVGTSVSTLVTNNYAENTRVRGISSLAGSLGGYFLGNEFGKSQYYTQGDATVIEMHSFTGALLGAYIDMFLQGISVDTVQKIIYVGLPAFSPRTDLTAPVLGAIAGLWGGMMAVHGKDFSKLQGLKVVGATVGGAMFGSALSSLLSQRGLNATAQWFGLAVGASAGLGIGMALTYVSPVNQDISIALSRCKVNVSPLGIIAASLPSTRALGLISMPICTFEYTFK